MGDSRLDGLRWAEETLRLDCVHSQRAECGLDGALCTDTQCMASYCHMLCVVGWWGGGGRMEGRKNRHQEGGEREGDDGKECR